MKNIKKNNYEFNFQKKALVSVISAVFTTVMTTGIAQASDIDIYQQAKSGDTTLMFMLDISASMSNKDNGTTTRMQRVKSAMLDLLNGNATNGVTQLSDDKIIGLSTLGVYTGSLAYNQGAVLVPARALNATITEGGKIITQRQKLVNVINGLSAATNTPTAKSYAETAAYLFGTTTRQDSPRYTVYFRRNNYNNWGQVSSYSYAICRAANSSGACTNWYGYYSGSPNSNWTSGMTAVNCSVGGYTGTCYTTTSSSDDYYSGFKYSDTSTKETVGGIVKYKQPDSLKQTEEAKKCSGQGIYVLTDGVPNFSALTEVPMKLSLGSGGNTFSCNDDGGAGWDCVHKYSQRLLNPDLNPSRLKIKTAVVGFGNDFNGVASYNPSLTQEENITALGALNTDEKNAAYWGIIGEGGWYSGNSSKDVVDSVNAFISSLNTSIPAVTTGSPTIPNDALYPAQLQNYAYYPQFDPTPDKNYQLWAGNLKKYSVSSTGLLVDKFANAIVKTTGEIKDNYDLWSPTVSTTKAIKEADENTLGSDKRALRGGVWSQLLLKFSEENKDARKLLTNRVGTSNSTIFSGGTALREVKTSDLNDPIYKNDPNRGYLLTLLGFNGLNVNSPNTITAAHLSNATELRQVGAVMHSSPLLLTNQGKIVSNSNNISTTDRKDYVLFGTTQGLLHVVDAVTGKEKFAFVPNEMVEKQKEAFLNHDTTSGGTNKLFYGIDSPWTAYTEYVVGSNRILTVGKGNNNQEGMQLVYGGLRMGGKSYYSLDLQNMDSPSLKFHIDPENKMVHYNNSSKTFTQLQYMGQSWSKPKIAWVRWNGERKMVMFVGGGYDMGYEDDAYNQTNAVGAGIYMFDALNGDLLWWTGKNATDTTSGVIGVNHADMKYSVVSEIRDVDSDSDGLVDNVYFGDLGGQVWRVDFDNGVKTATSKFARKPVRILNVNKNAQSPRFYDMPAFSIYSTNGVKFAVISVGSGNRSKPLAEYTFNNTPYGYDATYNIYDKDVARSDLLTTTSYYTKDIGLTGTLALKEIDNTTRFIQNTPIAAYATTGGWFYKFKSNKVQSAKVFGTPLVMNRKMYVSYFDASKPGLSGDCGAGVKGESFLSTFCMPYGQCVRSSGGNSGDDGNDDPIIDLDDIPLGAGIQMPTTGNDCPPGEVCKKVEDEDPDCLASGSRVLITPQGGTGGAKTEVCLTPLKWYEKLK